MPHDDASCLFCTAAWLRGSYPHGFQTPHTANGIDGSMTVEHHIRPPLGLPPSQRLERMSSSTRYCGSASYRNSLPYSRISKGFHSMPYLGSEWNSCEKWTE
jgi:hypothetical protein